MTLKEMISHLAYLDQKAAILDRRTKQAKAKAAAYEYQVHQRMIEDGFEVGDDIRHEGSRWGRQVDWYAAVQDPLEFNEWAEANAPHLIQPQPRKAKLNELVQQHIEDGTPLPPGLGATPKIWVSRRAVS
jgi:hypothetical protein